MDITERIKWVRKQNCLSQETFAKKIGISRSNMANIETGKVKLTERVAKDICKVYKINYLWLVEGMGEPITETMIDVFEEVKTEYNLSEDDSELLKEICELSELERNELKKYIRSLIKAKKES